MFGKEKREAEDQRDAAIGIAYYAILLANNGEQMLEYLNILVQYALDRNGNQYPYEDAIYVRDRILDRLNKTKGDKSYMEHGLDFKTTDQAQFIEAMNMTREANSVPKSWKQAQDDYFYAVSAGHKEKEPEWRENCKKYFGCNLD